MSMPLSTFSKFPDLPAEIRLRIWAQACHQPRNIGIWSDFQRCEVENTIFYTQLYESKLTQILPQPILLTSKEARAEALKHYIFEFDTDQSMLIHGSNRPLVISHPGFYINFECETLIPRGNWNIISLEDFVICRAQKQLRFLAIDITGGFYRDLYKEYILKEGWPFHSIEEVTLYDATGMAIFKKGYRGGKVELIFEDLEEPSSTLTDAEEQLRGVFVEMERKAQAISNDRTNNVTNNQTALVKKPRVTIKKLAVRCSSGR